MEKYKPWLENIPRVWFNVLLMMKFLLLFFCLGMVQASARVYSQDIRLTLNLPQVELGKALSVIEQKSDYRFLYNDAEVPRHLLVSLEAQNTPLSQVLTQLFLHTGLTFRILENHLIVIMPKGSSGEIISLKGKVTDSQGLPLAGVTIQIRGTSSGTVTNANGEYSLNVPDSAVLVVSYVGYQTQQIPVNGRSLINITLGNSNALLNQLVVVGYGTQRRKDITGATASVKGSELVKEPVLTATQAIQGKVAGVQIISSGQPGSAPQVRIRGTGTMLGGASPLYVVDGVITDDITNINMADITSVDILKDASSEAIYGVRAANGVIIITTKEGKAGKMRISYNANGGVRMASNLVKMANSQQYLDYEQAALGPTLNPSPYSTDWYDQILRNAIEQNHDISISGGSDKVRYLLSTDYYEDQGIVIDNVYKRFTLRSNNEFTLAKGLTLGMQASFSNAVTRNVNLGSAYNDAYRAAPLVQSMSGGKYGNTSLFQNVGNPILDIRDNNNHTYDYRLQGATYLQYKPTPWVTLRSSMGADLDNNDTKVYNDQFASDTSTFIIPGGNQSNTLSNLNLTYAKSFHWVWDNTATFEKQLGPSDIKLLVGTTAEGYSTEFLFGYRQNIPSDPNLWYLEAGDQNSQTNNGGGDKWTRNSYLSRINYSYRDKYLFTGTIRADGSSRFPAASRWGYFPALGAGWIISSESFMQTQKLFQLLKLRASWGKVGNDNIPSDAFTVTLTPNLPYFFAGNAQSGSAITQIKDKNLKWETTEEADMGLEFSALGNHLTGELDYYNKKTHNALIYVLIPATLGSQPNPNSSVPAGYVLTNAASVQNIGEELSLKWSSTIRHRFSYFIGGNITFNRNDVIGLNGGQPYIDGPVGADQPYVTRTDNGHPIGSFYVQKVIGVFQNQAEINSYTDANGNMLQPDAQPGDFKYQFRNGHLDSVFAGSYQPVAYYGISGGLSYGAFDFSFDCYGNYGNKVYNGKKAFRQSVLDNIEASTAINRWTNSDHTQTEPRANGGDLPASTYFVESGSFFRINNLTLGYTLPSRILEYTRVIRSLRIYVTSQNPLTIKKYSGFTAELPGTPTNAGIELNAYPTTKTFAVGLNMGF